MDTAEIAWAAGLFEGEGCAYFFKQKHHVLTHVRLSIAMTDKDVLDRFCRIVECGKVGPEKRRQKRQDGTPCKAVYVWQISNRSDTERVLLLFLPWLGERRTTKAREVLAEIARLDVVCEFCGTPYRAQRLSVRHFCGLACRNRWHYLNNRPAERPSAKGRPRTLEAPKNMGA